MRAKGAAAATHVVPYNQCRTQIINDRLSTPLTSMGDHLFNTLRERLPNGIKATLWPKQIQFSESMARTLRDQTMISQIVMSDASEFPGRDISCRHANRSVRWNVTICYTFEIARFSYSLFDKVKARYSACDLPPFFSMQMEKGYNSASKVCGQKLIFSRFRVKLHLPHHLATHLQQCCALH